MFQSKFYLRVKVLYPYVNLLLVNTFDVSILNEFVGTERAPKTLIKSGTKLRFGVVFFFSTTVLRPAFTLNPPNVLYDPDVTSQSFSSTFLPSFDVNHSIRQKYYEICKTCESLVLGILVLTG